MTAYCFTILLHMCQKTLQNLDYGGVICIPPLLSLSLYVGVGVLSVSLSLARARALSLLSPSLPLCLSVCLSVCLSLSLSQLFASQRSVFSFSSGIWKFASCVLALLATITPALLSLLLLYCCSALGRHSAPSTRRCCAAQRVRLRGLSPRPIPAEE